MDLRYFLSLFHKKFLLRLKYIGTEQVLQVFRVAIEMTLFFQKIEQVDHLFRRVISENLLFVGMINRGSFVQKIWSHVYRKTLL